MTPPQKKKTTQLEEMVISSTVQKPEQSQVKIENYVPSGRVRKSNEMEVSNLPEKEFKLL